MPCRCAIVTLSRCALVAWATHLPTFASSDDVPYGWNSTVCVRSTSKIVRASSRERTYPLPMKGATVLLSVPIIREYSSPWPGGADVKLLLGGAMRTQFSEHVKQAIGQTHWSSSDFTMYCAPKLFVAEDVVDLRRLVDVVVAHHIKNEISECHFRRQRFSCAHVDGGKPVFRRCSSPWPQIEPIKASTQIVRTRRHSARAPRRACPH